MSSCERLPGKRAIEWSSPWKARYEGEGRAPLEFTAEEIVVFEGDRIRHLEDVFDEAAAGHYEARMREHGEGLDVSYQ